MATVDGTELAEAAPNHPFRSGIRVWLTVTIAVLVLAELIVRLAEPALSKPQAWPTPELQFKYDRVTQLSSSGAPRTVLFGDSMVDAGADPRLMASVPGGVFNAALAGETLPTIASWATRVVVPRLHPTTAVVGFNINVLNPNIPNAAVVQQAYSGARVVKVAEGSGDLVDHVDTWLRAHVALYRYRSILRNVFQASSSAGGTSIYAPPLTSLGWNESFRALNYSQGPHSITPAEAQAEIKNDVLHDFVIGAPQAAAVGTLVDRLRHEGARVVFIGMPVAADFVAAVPGGAPAYTEALGRLLAIAQAHGARVLSPGIWPNRLFASPAHLNGAGTKRFSSWLSGQLTDAAP